MGLGYDADNLLTDCPVAQAERQVKNAQNQLDGAVKSLADAKAKLAAEAEAKKPKTVGERAAEGMIEAQAADPAIVFLAGGWGYKFLGSHAADDTLAQVRRSYAAAIDKAVADARAEEGNRWYRAVREATGFEGMLPQNHTPLEFARAATWHAKAEQREKSGKDLLEYATRFSLHDEYWRGFVDGLVDGAEKIERGIN